MNMQTSKKTAVSIGSKGTNQFWSNGNSPQKDSQGLSRMQN